MMRFKTYSSVLFLVALVSMSVDAVRAHGDHTTCISGREWFKGVEIDEITFGTIHGGWTTTVDPNSSAEDSGCIAAGWQPVGNTDGGEWHDRLRRTGDSGLGGTVTILGGKWSWEQANGIRHQGRIRQELDEQSSTVVWPKTLDEDIGCGAGIGKLEIQLSVSASEHTTGEATGCIDDTHGAVFPKVWGSLRVID